METVDVKVVNATPINATLNETVQMMNETLNSFDENTEAETEKEKEAVSFLKSFKDYIGSMEFRNDVGEVSKKYNKSPKEVAQNFFEKALGTVGDILGIAINVVCNAGRMVVNIVATVANSILNLLQSILYGVASIITCNKTCVATN